ncbi:MAG: response regulator transcription factor [Magnetococcales bacterium]|nr:response regulator transcription factor [Magnetococcales bacterium]
MANRLVGGPGSQEPGHPDFPSEGSGPESSPVHEKVDMNHNQNGSNGMIRDVSGALPQEITSFAVLLTGLVQSVERQNQRLAQLEEQLARLRPGGPVVGAPKVEGLLEVGPVSMDLVGHRVMVGGAEVGLAPALYAILKVFLSHPGQAFSRQELFELAMGRVLGEEGERTVDVHIRHLRQALGGYEGMIETVRGLGYRLTGPH